MIYDYYREKNKRNFKSKLAFGVIAFLIVIMATVCGKIYLEIIQLDEIGGFSGIYLKNLLYKGIFSGINFLIVFGILAVTSIFIKRNINSYLLRNGYEEKKLPVYSISAGIALLWSFLTGSFYQNLLLFLNSESFGKGDPLFGLDIGYYIFQRPFLMYIYSFFFIVWMFNVVYAGIYYISVLILSNDKDVSIAFTKEALSEMTLEFKNIIRHNFFNIGFLFLIKAFSYGFQKQNLLYQSVVGVTGANYVDVNVFMRYYNIAPILLAIIIILSFILINKEKFKRAAILMAIFPTVYFLVIITANIVQSFAVKPNEFNLESKYLQYNIEETREAYKLDKIRQYEFPKIEDLTPDIINKNINTKENIRIVDCESTLLSDIQLQSNTNFYIFHDGEIINYTINDIEIPIFIAAREIDLDRIPDKSYLNSKYKYTHGYGLVMNPINRVSPEGQVDFILNGLSMDTEAKGLKVTEPRIYYGEMTKNYSLVNAENGLNEIDYDGNTETRYTGKGGIKLSFLNKLLFSLKYGDFNMFISGYVSSDTKILLNREIVSRAQKALPFLRVDNNPYILLDDEGRLKWILDAYTISNLYPYSQYSENFNYIRNSVKIIIDAHDGKVMPYIIDKEDPIINAYNKMYPGIFIEEPVPEFIANHMRYPEYLFKIQTEIMKRYHLDKKEVSLFYSQQDLWDIAKSSGGKNTSDEAEDIKPYYNMIRLPGNLGDKEELILMRPFTPSGELKHNMVSWLAVRNMKGKYGEMILFNFPKNINIFGPNQVEVKINQIDKISKDMSLWSQQKHTDAYKGDLLVIPIDNSVLYVQPIYIKSIGGSSIPEMRELVLGYQRKDEFKYGIGKDLNSALNNLFEDVQKTQDIALKEELATNPVPTESTKVTEQQLIEEIIKSYDSLKEQMSKLDKLMSDLKK